MQRKFINLFGLFYISFNIFTGCYRKNVEIYVQELVDKIEKGEINRIKFREGVEIFSFINHHALMEDKKKKK